MELHAVFADPASDNKAVVGQLFVIGKTNRFVDRVADAWFADEERRRSERPLADDQRGGRADQHVAVLHVSGIADDAAVYRDGDVVRAPRVRAVVQRRSSTRSGTSSATISGRCRSATGARFAAPSAKTTSDEIDGRLATPRCCLCLDSAASSLKRTVMLGLVPDVRAQNRV